MIPMLRRNPRNAHRKSNVSNLSYIQIRVSMRGPSHRAPQLCLQRTKCPALPVRGSLFNESRTVKGSIGALVRRAGAQVYLALHACGRGLEHGTCSVCSGTQRGDEYAVRACSPHQHNRRKRPQTQNPANATQAWDTPAAAEMQPSADVQTFNVG